MNVFMGVTTLVDYSQFVLDSESVTVSSEREYAAFQRSHDDLHLKLSNLSNAFTAIFKTIQFQPTTQMRVEVYSDARRIFLGYVDPDTVEFDITGETLTLDAFSINKAFWELAKVTRIRKPTETNATVRTHYVTLERILLDQLLSPTVFRGLFTELAIDTLFINRKIRWWGDAHLYTDPTIGNTGRFRELDPTTTIAELLEAIALYYNAEFSIDEETLKFQMRKRGSVISNQQWNLEDKLLEDSSPTISLQDDERYDYLMTNADLQKPSPPVYTATQLIASETKGFVSVLYGAMFFSWQLTNVLDFGGLELESPLSERTGQYGIFYHGIGGNGEQSSSIWNTVVMTVGSAAANVTKRRLYRQDWVPVFRENYDTAVDPWTGGTYYTGAIITVQEYLARLRNNVQYRLPQIQNIPDRKVVGLPYQVDELEGNGSGLMVDDWRPMHYDAGQTFYAGGNRTGTVWFGYDSVAGTWSTPIFADATSQAPTGKIFEIFPSLRFTNIVATKEILPRNALDVIAFFGGRADFNLDTFVTQWIMMVKARAQLRGEFIGTSYRVGDTVKKPVKFYNSDILPGEELMIERARIGQETSHLEMVTK